MDHVGNFYKNLFSRESVKRKADCAQFLENINTPTISLHDKTLCNKELSIDELEASLSSMKANKSPGNDGLTIEFYKTFGLIYINHFSNLLNTPKSMDPCLLLKDKQLSNF